MVSIRTWGKYAVAGLLLAGMSLTAVAADKPAHNPMLHQHGMRIVDAEDQPVQLRGVNLGGWLVWEGWIFGKGILTPQATIVSRLQQAAGPRETEQFRAQVYDTFIDEADIAKIAAAGFNSVRVPLHYCLFDDDAGWKLLDRVLVRCERHRLYAILDLHMVPGSSLGQQERDPIWTSEKSRSKVVKLWKAIALRYRQRKIVAGYDLINEPLPPSGKELVSVYKQIIGAIREVDRDHLLFIEGGKFASDFSMFDKPLDGNQVYSFHMYTWFGDDRKKKLAEYVSLARRDDVPLWAGEFGENTYPMLDSTVAMYAQCPEIVGWSYWTWKKAAGHFPGLVTIRVPRNWAKVIDWVASFLGNNRPDAATVNNGIKEFLEAAKLKNCDYDQRMERILLRKEN